MFRRLQTKLTVLYAGLFGAALIFLSIAVYAAVAANAKLMVRAELQTGGQVIERLWTMRSNQLRDGAALLGRDFGFRSAMATGDQATIASALDNLKQRLDVDSAFVIGVDGAIIAGGQAAAPVADALMADEEASGVIQINGAPYQAISAPILSPALAGWIVFASRLDETEMRSLEALSAIPLDAAVLQKTGAAWVSGRAGQKSQQTAINRFLDRHADASRARVADLNGAGPSAIALVKQLKTMDPARPAVLMLRYPLSRALAAYRPLLALMVLVGAVGMALLAWGSWALAKTLTRPISALDAAVHRLQAGEHVEVEIATDDEVGRLARSFNTMASAIRERERRITALALHDSDTGLPNRLALERAIREMTENGATVVVAAFGIDRFAHTRGAIGYGLASELIGEVGRRLAAVAPDAKVARLSTDTLGAAFIAKSLGEAERMAGEIRAALELPVRVGEATVDVAATVGLAAWPVHADSPNGLVDRANIALDQARARSRKSALFDETLYGDPAANLSLMSEMVEAIADGTLAVYYQPKFDLRSRQVAGVEALVRWPHAKRGMLPPDLFVGMAEDTGHIRALTDYVLARALDDQRTLSQAGYDLSMSVNLSGRLAGDDEFAEHALALAADRAGDLCLEITETAVIDNPDAALALLDRYAGAGIEISIDDYGSGLSSLSYLKRIRASELKIDKSFVLGMADSKRDALLIRSTIDLAHGLGLKVTAEGVETAEALALLAGMGCDCAQGFLIARPMPLNELLRFLDQDKASEQTSALRGDERVQDAGFGPDGRMSRRAGVRRA